MKIVVTLCTRERPRMLRECLGSLTAQQVPIGVAVAIVVVENDRVGACRGIVEEAGALPGAPRVVYAHEPRVGIPIARNRAMDLALKEDPDWIAFIDDDEVAGPGWIAALAHAAASTEADVLQGPVEWQEQVEESAVARHLRMGRERKHRPTGTRLRTAATNNTMMRPRLVRPDGLGLRFDETMRFTGGSDGEFFARAARRGAAIVWVDEAIVQERLPPERLTLSWQLQRERRVAANNVCVAIRHRGFYYAASRKGLKCVVRLARACLELPAGGLLYPFSPRLGSRTIAGALRRICWAAGAGGALLGLRPQPYVTVQGD